MKRARDKRRGQALVMITLGLFALCGMLGLAVDLGWSFFVKKEARAAADSAALAAAYQALKTVGLAGTFSCGSNVDCAQLSCGGVAAGNFLSGCLYAQQNGFRSQAPQEVTMVGGTTFPPPTAPGVTGYYWVTARARQDIPQLFSAVLGNLIGRSSGRATAAVTDFVWIGSLILLNRERDPSDKQGENIFAGTGGGGGNSTITAEGPIMLSSGCPGAPGCPAGAYAGDTSRGNWTIQSPDTEIRGGYTLGGSASWTATPNTNVEDGPFFTDPMEGVGQPPRTLMTPIAPDPANSVSGNVHPLPDGRLSAAECNPCGPGFYYAVDSTTGIATGGVINVIGNVTFNNGGSFGDFVFFGGLNFNQTGQVATFTTGRYILAGARAETGYVMNTSNAVTLTDNGVPGGQNSNAGEIFILTNSSYLDRSTQKPPAMSDAVWDSLTFQKFVLKAGNTDQSLINLHGLNDQAGSGLPPELNAFSPFVIWQDHDNSNVVYNPDGTLNTSTACGGDGTINQPCYRANSPSREMTISASSSMHLYGAVYQPRGSWLNFDGGSSTYAGPMQVISGAIKMTGGAKLNLQGISNPITTKTVALVE